MYQATTPQNLYEYLASYMLNYKSTPWTWIMTKTNATSDYSKNRRQETIHAATNPYGSNPIGNFMNKVL